MGGGKCLGSRTTAEGRLIHRKSIKTQTCINVQKRQFKGIQKWSKTSGLDCNYFFHFIYQQLYTDDFLHVA